MWRCRNNILSSVNSRLRCLSSPVNDDAWDVEALDVDGDHYYVDDDGNVNDDDAWDVESLDDDDVLSWLSNVQGE